MCVFSNVMNVKGEKNIVLHQDIYKGGIPYHAWCRLVTTLCLQVFVVTVLLCNLRACTGNSVDKPDW